MINQHKQFTVSIVFLSITKMPSTLNPIGSPFIRLRNTFSCTIIKKNKKKLGDNAKNKRY